MEIRQFGNANESLSIGNYCSIGPRTVFLLGGGHVLSHLSSYSFRYYYQNVNESTVKGPIIIDDDVWIGYGATILSGVHIGQGAVIGAGAMVCDDIPPYAIAGGVPAKVIRYRFTHEIIEFLLTLDFEVLDDNLINEHIEELCEPIDEKQLDDVKKCFSWFQNDLISRD